MAAATESIDVVIGAKAMYEATLKKAQSDFDKYGKSVVAIYVKIKAAQIALTKAWDLADAAAKFDQQEQAFTNLAASHGENARQIIRNLQAISGHTVSTAAIMQSAGTAMTLGIPAEHLSKMMEIARASSKVMGETTEVMFEKLTVGLARMSKLRLDDLGILIDTNKANEEYAATLGILSKNLTDAQKKQAFLNGAMKAGQDIIDRVGESTFSAADATAVFTATMEDMKIVAGKVIITTTSSLTGVAFAISKVFAQMLKTAATAIGKFDQLLGKLPFYKATPAILEFADAQGMAAKEAGRLRDQSFEVATAIWKEKEAVEGLARAKKAAGVTPDAGGAIGDMYGPKQLDGYQKFLQQKISAHEAAQARIRESEQGTYMSEILGAQNNLTAIQQYHKNKVQMAWVSGATQTEMIRLNAEAEVAMEKAKNDAKISMARSHLQAATGFMHNLFIATGSKNKKMFEASKAFATGEAIMNTYSGATKAFAQYGWPYGAVAAALVIAAGMAQVRQIQSQTMGGGASASSVSSGGAVSVSPTVYGDTGAGSLIGTGQDKPQQSLTIKVSFNSTIANREEMAAFLENDLLPIMQEAQDRDVVLDYGSAA